MEVPLLLAAVSATSPCGEDLEYDADFLRLERDSQGQPERSMGDSILPAAPPEWRSIQQQSLVLLQRSKDLRITHFLLQSSLALEGVTGLARVLTLISELLKQYWADLHPRLDAEDDNDPTVRINALAGLTSDATIRLLRESILARSRTFGAVSLRAAANASGLQSFPDENLGAEQLAGAFLDSDPEQLEITRAALQEASVDCRGNLRVPDAGRYGLRGSRIWLRLWLVADCVDHRGSGVPVQTDGQEWSVRSDPQLGAVDH